MWMSSAGPENWPRWHEQGGHLADNVHLCEDRRGLETSLGLRVNGFLNKLVPAIELSSVLFHLGLDRRLESFAKETNQGGLVWSPVGIKLN